MAFWELVMDISTGRLWRLCSQIILGVVHCVKTSGCGIRDSLTLPFSGKGERLAGHAHTHTHTHGPHPDARSQNQTHKHLPWGVDGIEA